MKEKIRPTFVLCPLCKGVGFYMFDGKLSISFEDPTDLARIKCEKCSGTGEIVYDPQNPET